MVLPAGLWYSIRVLRITALGFLLAIAALPQERPEGVPISIWVREDLFAGFLADSMDDFNRGVAKLDYILAETPDDPRALAWRASADIYLAVRAAEVGRAAEYERLFASSNRLFDRSLAIQPDGNIAYLAISGGMATTVGDRIPEKDRRRVWQRGLNSYLQLEQAQKETFDKMPVHHRGEVLGGVAHLAQRLGDADRARSYAGRVVQTLASTPYESPARAVAANPASDKPVKVGCMSCHEPNRLDAFTARLARSHAP